jgi:hypothetical protein
LPAQSADVQKVLDRPALNLNEVLVTKDVSLGLWVLVDPNIAALAAASPAYPDYLAGPTRVTLNSYAQTKRLTGVVGNDYLSNATLNRCHQGRR